MLGWLTSSVRYSNRRDGSARNSKIMAGRIVQIVFQFVGLLLGIGGCICLLLGRILRN